MYGKRECEKSLAIASLLPYFGPALGPIFGDIIAQSVGPIDTLVGYYFIRESYTPVLLRRKAKSEAMSTPNSKRTFKIQYWQELFPPFSVGLFRPFQILIRRPLRLKLGVVSWTGYTEVLAQKQHPRQTRVSCSMDGAILIPIGLFWYGWVAEVTGPLAVVDIGASVFTSGNMVVSQGLLVSQLDESGRYGASANAAS
ncbi:uncharacterized protein EAE97_011875 [Botrytis byssoidea]|uniref:Major facilitator superfamily (MFS) profile domain-containing protein n=1 Tax=Botrytis byssoidea TaxID=139641 RepID=A0A9P5HUG5_9HELO|nr:uncharacterized protein EAE97_011875 [Botrytis byssoidea]KAF7918420.1 hypothetical protein EAE97_011875 [Botrytis byssoidea]